MRKLYETLLGVVESGLHPREVGVAVFLGTLAGFVTGWNLSLALVLVLALVMAAPLRVFGQVWAFSAALAWALTPASYRLGVQLLEHSSLGEWLRPHAYSVWVALFDLDRFTLVGGAVLGALIGILAGGIAAFITRSLQTRYLKLVDRFAAHDDLLGRLAIRISSWLIFGSLSRPQPVRARARLLRPVGAVAGVLLLLPGGFALWQYTPQWTSSGMLAALSAANQAEVEAADVQLSLADGLLIIDELHIPNAADLHRDRLVLGRVLAEVKPGPLLRGKVLIDRLLIEGIETNVARAAPARPCKLEFPAFDLTQSQDSPEAAGGADRGSFDFVLDDYVENWEQTRQRLEKFRELLEEMNRLAGYGRGGDDAGQADAQGAGVPESYRQMWAARCDFGQPRPQFLVQSLRVKNPSTKWGLGQGTECDITNLSSDAPLTGKPTEVKFAAPELGVAVLATLNYHQPGTEHRLRVQVRELAVDDLIRPEKLGQRWSLAGGQMDISAVGEIHNGQLNLPVMIGTSDLMLLVMGDEKVAGLSPELWNQGLQKLNRFEFAAVLRGPLLRPTLHLETEALTKYFRDQLHAAGHAVLVAAIDRELNRGQVRLDEALAKGAAEAHQATGAVANQAHALADQADASVQQAHANTQSTLDRGEQSIGSAQDRARQYAGGAAGDATGQVAQGQQKAADWLKEQQARLNPLAGIVPGLGNPAGVQSVPDGQAQPQAAAPAYDAAQGLIGHAAQVVQQQVQSRQQQAEQTITSASERPYYAVESARTATGQASSYAGEGVATARSGVTATHQQATGTIDTSADTIQQSASQASDQIRAAVASAGPAAAVPLIPPAVVEGDVVPVDYPPEPETAPAPPQMAATPAPAPPIEPADSATENSNPSGTAEATDRVAETGPAVSSRRAVEPAPAAPVSNKAAAQAKAPSRYSPETIARGWVDPYATANDKAAEDAAPANRVTDPYGSASVASPVGTIHGGLAADTGSGATSSEGEPAAGSADQEHRSASAEERSVRSAARSAARSRYASSRPYGAPAYQSDRSTDEQQPASDATAADETAVGRYRSQYDPLHQEDAAARPRALTSQPGGRYGAAHDDTSEPGPSASVAERGTEPSTRVYGLKPGQRYSSDYPAGSATDSKPSERARQNMGTASASERRWSNVPLGDLPGESTFGTSPHELVTRDPSPRELPEVEPPRPPETASAPLGRSPGGRARGALFGSTSDTPPAPSDEDSGIMNRLRRIWPFNRESGETAATATEDSQPEAEMAQRPALPPITAEVPADSVPAAPMGDEAAPAVQETKPWYRRLW